MVSIAIDGPSGAGKSSLARCVSEKLGYVYVDTGALYRAIGLAVLRSGKDATNLQQVAEVLPSIHLKLAYKNGEQRVYLGQEDVSEAIRDEKISMTASVVSAHVPVRDFLLETQRRLACENNVIMDGRDIGTVVLPNAMVKIYLTASVEKRAQRRYLQLKEKQLPADLETIRKDVIQRDNNDMNRTIAPLKQAKDAVLVDTTNLTFEESCQRVLEIIQTRINE